METPTPGKVKQFSLPDTSGTGGTPTFWVVHDESSAPYSSLRAVATLAPTRARQFLSHDDHCVQSQGVSLQKHLSQHRNEQVGAAILFVSRVSWPSLRVPANVATAAAQSGVLDTTASAHRLQQNESGKVVAEFP